MSRSQLTILTNICLIEDLETQRVVMQYRSPETNRWSGYAFPGGHVENGESFAESVIREIYEETGLTIQNPQLVGIKNWPLDTGGRYIVIPNFKLKLATQKKFTWRLVVQAFFRVVVNPIFDKSYFFRSRFLGSFR